MYIGEGSAAIRPSVLKISRGTDTQTQYEDYIEDTVAKEISKVHSPGTGTGSQNSINPTYMYYD